MSPGDTVILSGRGDLGMTRAIRKHLNGPVVVVKITKAGLYQVRAPDGSLWSVPKRNLLPEREGQRTPDREHLDAEVERLPE